MRVMCTKKVRTLSQLGAEKIAFPPKPDIRTDGHKQLQSSFATKKTTYRKNERHEEQSGHTEHDAQTNNHQSLPARPLNQHQGHEGHGNVHGAHAEGGRLAGRLVQARALKDSGGEEDGGVDTFKNQIINHS